MKYKRRFLIFLFSSITLLFFSTCKKEFIQNKIVEKQAKTIFYSPDIQPIQFTNRFGYEKGKIGNIDFNKKRQFLEVHASASTNGIYYILGHSDGSKIKFSDSEKYGTGNEPNISINDQGIFVEVHQSGKIVFPSGLFYYVGKHNGDKIDLGESNSYDKGKIPKVSINNDNVVVEVHQSLKSTDLYYHVGTVNPETKKIDFEKGRLTATIYDKIMPRLIAMQKYGYIRYKLAEALSLEKKHSQRLFELLLMNHGINKNHIWKIELKDFKSLMYCENKYKNRIQDFNKYVLIPTLEDINKNTSVNAKCEVVKEGRINYLIFVIKVREKLQKGKEKLDIKKLDERSLRCWRKLEEFGIIKDDLLRKIVLNEDLQSKFWKWLSKNNDNIKNGYFNNVAGLILSYLNVK
jgi:hypothetical protein